ncbi:MAG: hypothetical protein WA322_15865 [Pseudolabrys sp.]
MNPNVGQFEIEQIQQMADDFEMYLDNAVMLYCQSQGPMPPQVFRSLLVLLRYCDEEGDLAERQGKGEDIKDHIAFEIRRLAHWATSIPGRLEPSCHSGGMG